ncbi:hypothetical protein E2C01_000804 [Portunus trituberculatus]|uniref:Uncharacterized protein n=1 Tax=Portunus trituberculatus TaxID=210409 RepID=A0A5B7CFL7_PORTR|nr:hypothetical protein [Portunus trituberculatus]
MVDVCEAISAMRWPCAMSHTSTRLSPPAEARNRPHASLIDCPKSRIGKRGSGDTGIMSCGIKKTRYIGPQYT